MWIGFFACLLFSIFIHELAHLLVALKCGVGVKTFSLGFWKPYLSKTIKGIEYRITPWLIGGFCDIKGMDSKKDSDDFLSQRYFKKFLILIAGVSANFLVACICYLINYGSISIGIQIDWILIKSIFTKVFSYPDMLFLVTHNVGENFILLQLGMINFFCAITNSLPIPALDLGHAWIVLMEKPWKEKFIERYIKITNTCFWLLLIIQVPLIIWVWF